jgi:hypothetical protein
VLIYGREATGGCGRRSRAAGAAGARAPERLWVSLGNKQWKELLQGLGRCPGGWAVGNSSGHGSSVSTTTMVPVAALWCSHEEEGDAGFIVAAWP